MLTDQEADDQACDAVHTSLWAFVPSFLSSTTGIDEAVFTAIADNNRCEDNNDAVLSIINGTCGFDKLSSEALSADGRGHFLSGYDGEEHEVTLGDTTLYFYRTN